MYSLLLLLQKCGRVCNRAVRAPQSVRRQGLHSRVGGSETEHFINEVEEKLHPHPLERVHRASRHRPTQSR